MAVIPSFSAFARGPDLAGAQHAARSLAEQARQANLQFAVQKQQLAQQRQQLAQEGEMANMQFMAAQQRHKSDSMRADAQMAIDRAYKESVIGLNERKLDMAESQVAQQAQQAQAQFEAAQQYAQYKAEGMSDEDALGRVVMSADPRSVNAWAQAQRAKGGADAMPAGTSIPVEGTGGSIVHLGGGRTQYAPPRPPPSETQAQIKQSRIETGRIAFEERRAEALSKQIDKLLEESPELATREKSPRFGSSKRKWQRYQQLSQEYARALEEVEALRMQALGDDESGSPMQNALRILSIEQE